MVSEVRKRPSGADHSPVHDEHPQPKRTKTGSAQSAAPYARSHAGATGKIDSNGDKYWEISKMRRVTISTFRGKTMVNIREYYEKDGQELPGKKVSSLSPVVFTLERVYSINPRVFLCRLINLPR
ncbi:transcriptional coactivator p15/PC4 family protein [Aspergillus melleus]|uniref:transcriptional coactivator p15/PC4 family protein n=1 Tax=Aspergillus melleus TaxID=138277 RepID=UPI001E8E0769|nr:uncharacterized protein LDX57_003404 [Aspergillus melleus]KAH8425655.1 hypothetical protein LDX57_003404 [Aspergillus melleus]